MSDATVRKLEEAFALGCNTTEAAYYADISRDTLYNWMKHNEEFSDKMERQKARPVLQARRTIVKKLTTDPKVAMWYLERRARDEFERDATPQMSEGPRSIAELVASLSGEDDHYDPPDDASS